MGFKISNFLHVGLNILVLFKLIAVVESDEITGPQLEVVSIYDDNFGTPPYRPQYFIEVHRCVKVELSDCSSKGPNGYPVPNTFDKIEIVVPDVTNDARGDKKKFYEYVVYNHTSCKCGTFKYRNTKLYENITNNEVSEDYFKANFSKNPDNLLRRCDVYNKPQQRYKLAHKHQYAHPQLKYLAYKQCLPGNVVEDRNTSGIKVSLFTNKVVTVNLTSDISCKAYDSGKKATNNRGIKATLAQQSSSARSLGDPAGNSPDQEPDYEMLVYIGSGKMMLAAFLLSLVLFTILIMDFTLCRRKKGFLYALFGCKNDDVEIEMRNRNEIRV